MHAVLELSNRTEVARRLRQRGYQVSGETLSRWYRTKQEIPQAIAQEIARLFGLNENEAPPAEASGALEQQIAALMTRDEVQTMVAGIEQRVTEAINRGVTAQAEEMVDRFVDQMIEALLRRAPQLAVSDARPRPGSGSE